VAGRRQSGQYHGEPGDQHQAPVPHNERGKSVHQGSSALRDRENSSQMIYITELIADEILAARRPLEFAAGDFPGPGDLA
jgi:hypothetical protein